MRSYPAFISWAYGLPKIHNRDYPLRLLVSTINGATYSLAFFLLTILILVMGESVHHVKYSEQFF